LNGVVLHIRIIELPAVLVNPLLGCVKLVKLGCGRVDIRNRRLDGKFLERSLWLFGIDEWPDLFVDMGLEVGKPWLPVFGIRKDNRVRGGRWSHFANRDM